LEPSESTISLGGLVDEFSQEKSKQLPRNVFIDTVRGAENDEIKDWPKEVKMDICWRVPQDNQRIMIFEKLGYAVQQYEIERNKK